MFCEKKGRRSEYSFYFFVYFEQEVEASSLYFLGRSRCSFRRARECKDVETAPAPHTPALQPAHEDEARGQAPPKDVAVFFLSDISSLSLLSLSALFPSLFSLSARFPLSSRYLFPLTLSLFSPTTSSPSTTATSLSLSARNACSLFLRPRIPASSTPAAVDMFVWKKGSIKREFFIFG